MAAAASNTPTRRTVLGFFPAVPLAVATVSLWGSTTTGAEISRLYAKGRFIEEYGASEEDCAEHLEKVDAMLAEIQGMPLTMEAARLRAQLVLAGGAGSVDDTAEGRAVRQILATLVAQ